MELKVLGMGCANCGRVYANAKKAIAELGVEVTLEKVENINEIIGFGVLMTPAVVIDGVVKASGRIPSTEELKQWLQE